MLDLKGRVAVVTGGTRGIGRAIAESLVRAGGRVVLGARNGSEVELAAQALADERPGERVAIGVRCDVRSFEDCRTLIDAAVSTFGRLDILVNNAGIGGYASVADLEPDHWRAVIETNLNGVYYCTHLAIPHLRKSGESWIINIGSLAGRNAFAGGSAYNASKFGLIGFSEAVMQDVRHEGIRVTYIMPGSVATEFGGHRPGQGDEWKIQPEDIGQIVTDLLSMPSRTLPSRIEVRPARPPKP